MENSPWAATYDFTVEFTLQDYNYVQSVKTELLLGTSVLALINELEDGTINHSKSGLNFQNVSFTGNFHNGQSKSKQSFSVKLADFEAQLYSSQINGSLSMF